MQNQQPGEWKRDYTIEGTESEKPSRHPAVARFFREYSYDAVRLFLNQFVTAIFGLVLALAAGMAGDSQNFGLMAATSIGAVLFYLFLTYTTAWSVGSRDRLSVQSGKRKLNLFYPLFTSLLANLINYIAVLLYGIGMLCGADNLAGVGKLMGLLLQGMYDGLLSICVPIGGESRPLHELWWMFFITTLPSVAMTLFAYMMGLKDKHLTGMLKPQMPQSDREEKETKKKK